MAKKGQLKSSAKSAATPRVRKATKRQKKAAVKKETKSSVVLPSSFQLIGRVYKIIRQNWWPLGGIVLVYLLINAIFASGFSNISTTFSDIKNNLTSAHSFSQAISGFGTLVSNAGITSSQTASISGSVLIVLGSLVIIWALRQLLAGEEVKVKQAFYSSTTPLVPFLLVIFAVILQLLPISLGSALAALIFSTLFSSSGLVAVLMVLVITPLAIWSLYMLSSSILALYIVTLPDMQPRQALRAAKNLVRFRRFAILRKLLFLPLFIILAMSLVMLPLILFIHFLVVPVFFVLSALAILVVHTYLYSLYRSLL